MCGGGNNEISNGVCASKRATSKRTALECLELRMAKMLAEFGTGRGWTRLTDAGAGRRWLMFVEVGS